ncbi:sensor domain-containing diguanylate cyclase [Rhodoferax ferrireducens]|uniref:sensor domain-containing diguanylate cyclase n=1 Tax=Rhodoferax ferrireducens TaxID=192843 RepID=UPI000E0CC783|nr:sensor domain-containing diguanylate cyclase [Rhodoferax ferrireducens]
MRSGRWPTQAAINVLALGAWGGVTGIAIFMDGVRPPIVIAYLVIILSTVLFSFLVRAYRKRLNELHTVGRDLARRTFDLKASQAELHRAQAVAKVGSWVFDIGADTMRLSTETCRIFGLPEGTTGSHAAYLKRVHPDDREAVDRAWLAAFKGETFDHEHRIVVGHAVRWVRQKAELEFAPDGAPLSAIGIAQDITAHKEVQAALQDSEERYRTMIEWSPESILVHRLGKILYVNSAAIKLFGAKDAQGLLGKSTTELIHPDYLEAQMARMKSINEHVLIKPMVESRFLKLDGAAIDVEVQGTAIVYDARPAIHVCIRDITERKQMEKQVHQLAFYDTLTELPNRRLLNDRLGQSIAASKRSGRYGALIFLDLDNFKPLNDTHGHDVGDLLLADAASRLQTCVREQDTVARFGGDEFVVMLCELDSDKARATTQAAVIAEIIRSVLTEPYRLCIRQDGKEATFIEHLCTVSIGVALFVNHEASQDDILKWADTAMYQSKKAGGNLVLFHDATV